MAIAGAIIAGVTAIYGATSGAQRAHQARNASVNAQYARYNSAQANMMLSTASQSGIAVQQLFASSGAPGRPQGVPPWMAGGGQQGPGGAGPGMR